MLLFLTLLVLEPELSKKLKSQLDKKNLRNNLMRKEENKINRCSQLNQNQFLNMSKKIYMRKLQKIKKGKENRDWKDSDWRVNRICIQSLHIYCQNQRANLYTNERQVNTNLLPSLYHGIVKWICWKESRNKRTREEREFLNKSSTNTMISIFLKESRKCLKEDKRLNRINKDYEPWAKQLQMTNNALSTLK